MSDLFELTPSRLWKRQQEECGSDDRQRNQRHGTREVIDDRRPHVEQATEFVLLAALPDPFDRLIVAAARTKKLPLVTADERIADSGLVDVVWD